MRSVFIKEGRAGKGFTFTRSGEGTQTPYVSAKGLEMPDNILLGRCETVYIREKQKNPFLFRFLSKCIIDHIARAGYSHVRLKSCVKIGMLVISRGKDRSVRKNSPGE